MRLVPSEWRSSVRRERCASSASGRDHHQVTVELEKRSLRRSNKTSSTHTNPPPGPLLPHRTNSRTRTRPWTRGHRTVSDQRLQRSVLILLSESCCLWCWTLITSHLPTINVFINVMKGNQMFFMVRHQTCSHDFNYVYTFNFMCCLLKHVTWLLLMDSKFL